MTATHPVLMRLTAAIAHHSFDYSDRVTLLDGRLGTVFQTGYKHGWVDADTEPDWRGKLAELRPETPDGVG